MQRVLEQMAKKLNAYDEASLMQLWQLYATRVRDFEPTQRWEEATLALCLVQAVHWKNQLFNYNLALSNSPSGMQNLPPLPDFFTNRKKSSAKGGKADEDEAKRPRATVLHFPGRQSRTQAPAQEKDGEENRDQLPDADGIPADAPLADAEKADSGRKRGGQKDAGRAGSGQAHAAQAGESQTDADPADSGPDKTELADDKG